MFKMIKKIFTKKPTAEQRQEKLYNDLATLSLINIALKNK